MSDFCDICGDEVSQGESECSYGHSQIHDDAHTLALVSEAYEVAAQHHDRHADGYRRCSPHDAAAHEEHARRIRALAPADAIAAREADRKQVREEALREAKTSELAAELLNRWHPANVTQAQYPDSVPFRAALLALIEKDKTNEPEN